MSDREQMRDRLTPTGLQDAVDDEPLRRPTGAAAFGGAPASGDDTAASTAPTQQPAGGGPPAPSRRRRLVRSRDDRMIAGVCGGIARYLGVDSTIVRVVFVVGAFAFGPGLVAYLVLWIAMPNEPR